MHSLARGELWAGCYVNLSLPLVPRKVAGLRCPPPFSVVLSVLYSTLIKKISPVHAVVTAHEEHPMVPAALLVPALYCFTVCVFILILFTFFLYFNF
jgi:hypothetical protein